VLCLPLLLQASALVQPLYLAPEPPPLRAARHILVLEKPSGAPGDLGRTSEEALTLSLGLIERLRAGEPFADLAREHSQGPNAPRGGELGSFARGMLPGELDEFLFSAEVGELSGPLITRGTVHLLQRVETYAAVREILFTRAGGSSLSRARSALADLRGGADFAQIAAQRSDGAGAREPGGRLSVFERDRLDSPLKAAAFAARVGEIVGPIETAAGHHLLRRVSLSEAGPVLVESPCVRLRALLVSHAGAAGAPPELLRTPQQALALAWDLHRRLSSGEDFAEVAAAFNDDPGGRDRAGDLGWVHGFNPSLPGFLEPMFSVEAGFLSEPLEITRGFVLVRRER
jgi:parvulin-like peptidyl-prolyl isomerase